MKKLVIIGSGNLGRLIAHHAINCKLYDVVGFINDFEKEGTLVNNIPIIGKIENIEELYRLGKFDFLLIGIGYNHFDSRKSVFERFSKTIPFATLIHPSAYVDKITDVGAGSVILPGCTLDYNVKIGNNVLLNTSVAIAHNSKISDHSFLSPRVAVAGYC